MRKMTRLSSCSSLVRCSLVVFMVALILVMIGFLRAEAETIVVDDNCSLMNAIVSANFDSSVGGCTAGSGADTIVLVNTTYVFTQPSVNFGAFPQISGAIVISGNGAIIQRDLSFSCPPKANENAFAFFAVGPSDTLTLDNVALQNGCSEAGGAIVSAGRLLLNNSRIMSSTAAVSAGVYAPSGVVTVTNSSFISNTALNTGGGMIFNEGKVEKSDFYLNTAKGEFFLFDYDGGGAALVLQGPNAKYLSSNRFTQNYSVRDGAAIYVVGTAHMDNNLLAANEASGGSVSADIAVGRLANLGTSKLFGAHNTLVARPSTGATAVVAGLGVTGTQVFLTDTIISGYEQGLVTLANGTIVANGLLWDDTAVPTQTVTGAITVNNAYVGNAAFVDPAGGDYQLSAASDAIGRGVSNPPSTDFEGDPRPVGILSDLGYDEFDPTVSVAVSKTVGTEAGSCASATSLTVDANTAVYYCVTLYNNGEVTFTDHTLTDAQLGVQAILSFNVAPGETVQFIHSLISALGPVTMTESLTNTVFVTSTNVVGPDARAAGAMIVPATATDSAQAVVIVEQVPPVDEKRLLLPKLERQ